MIDLNADMGEYAGSSEEAKEIALMPLVTSCSIACGGHAGTVETMTHTTARALAAGVSIGAHPSYPDRAHFGRRSIKIDDADLLADLRRQIAMLSDVIDATDARLAHVKPHGALYNDAAGDSHLAAIVVAAAPAGAAIFGPPGSALASAAAAAGRRFVAEGFADRRYLKRGVLTPRSRPDAILATAAERAEQAVALATGCEIAGVEESFAMLIDTLCLHGDDPAAVETARALRAALAAAGVAIGAPT